MNKYNIAQLRKVCKELEVFEAGESQRNTGTGKRTDGNDFEKLIEEYWKCVAKLAIEHGAVPKEQVPMSPGGAGRNRRTGAHRRYTFGSRSIYLPQPYPDASVEIDRNPRIGEWLRLSFNVEETARAYPGPDVVREKYAPRGGPYAGDQYWQMFSGMSTNFDDTVVMEDGGVLVEKILFEYKTAKSSKGRCIDGNAHERLSFQVLQYLEVATKFTACRLEVLANGAFKQYKNKYHLGFNQQADRLSSFRWFDMRYRCEAEQYESLAGELLQWLSNETAGLEAGGRK